MKKKILFSKQRNIYLILRKFNYISNKKRSENKQENKFKEQNKTKKISLIMNLFFSFVFFRF